MSEFILVPILVLLLILSLASLFLAKANRPRLAPKDTSAIAHGVTCPNCGIVWPFKGTGPSTVVCRNAKTGEGCGHQFLVGVVNARGPKRLLGLIPGVPAPKEVRVRSRGKG